MDIEEQVKELMKLKDRRKAKFLGVDQSTIFRWKKKGILEEKIREYVAQRALQQSLKPPAEEERRHRRKPTLIERLKRLLKKSHHTGKKDKQRCETML